MFAVGVSGCSCAELDIAGSIVNVHVNRSRTHTHTHAHVYTAHTHTLAHALAHAHAHAVNLCRYTFFRVDVFDHTHDVIIDLTTNESTPRTINLDGMHVCMPASMSSCTGITHAD